MTLGLDLCYLGRAEQGLARLDAARRAWEAGGGGARELATVDVYGDLSDALLMLGRLDDAARVALDGLATAARLDVEASVGIVLAAHAVEALVAAGEWERARAVGERARLAPGTSSGSPTAPRTAACGRRRRSSRRGRRASRRRRPRARRSRSAGGSAPVRSSGSSSSRPAGAPRPPRAAGPAATTRSA